MCTYQHYKSNHCPYGSGFLQVANQKNGKLIANIVSNNIIKNMDYKVQVLMLWESFSVNKLYQYNFIENNWLFCYNIHL